MVRFRHRQWLEQHRIHNAEDGCISANAKGKSNNSDNGEAGRFRKGAQPIANVLNEGKHTSPLVRLGAFDSLNLENEAGLRHLSCLLRGFRFFDHFAVKEMNVPLSMLGKARV